MESVLRPFETGRANSVEIIVHIKESLDEAQREQLVAALDRKSVV